MMTKYIKYILLFFGILIFFSCRKDTDEFKEALIGGDWVFIPEQPKFNIDKEDTLVRLVNMKPPNGYYKSYSFLNGEKYEDKRGFFNEVDGMGRDHRKIYFLGNESKYEIKDDSLRLYNLRDKKWNSFGIIGLKSDTLSLNTSSGDTIRFQRQQYDLRNKPGFDQVIISSSGCYGSCPIADVLVDKTGTVIFNGKEFTTQKGLYKSKISEAEFLKIQESFQKANWQNLRNEYAAGATDQETVSITFIKNGKVIKTISDYGHESPQEFIWAYQPLRYLYQQVKKLEPIDNCGVEFGYFSVYKKKKLLFLEESEQFFLYSLFLKAKRSDKKVSPVYSIKTWSTDKEAEITSDGQLFTFKDKTGKNATLDLGFDFFRKNNLENRLTDEN